MRFAHPESNESCTAVILKRAGKATGKYKNTFNMKFTSPDSLKDNEQYVDLDRVQDLEILNDTEANEMEPSNVYIMKSEEGNDIWCDAKKNELKSWNDNNVFKEVESTDKNYITTRWVCTMKKKNGEMIPKARLVARGFEEFGKDHINKDAPTCCREAIRVLIAIAKQNSWSVKSIDIKTAFLQGNLFGRRVFLKPPKEAMCPKGVVWELNKPVYGLVDASKSWFNSVKQFLISIDGRQTTVDPSVFYWHYKDSDIHGCLLVYVDDFLWTGNSNFKDIVIGKIYQKYTIGSQLENGFQYVGVRIQSIQRELIVDQFSYANAIDEIPLSYPRSSAQSQTANIEERDQLRSKIGQLLWLSGQTRPDLSFDTSQLASNLCRAEVKDLKLCNKVIKKAKTNNNNNKFKLIMPLF